jgi:hypothetical protein
MPQSKFDLGQTVTYARPTLITPAGHYEVVRIFPEEGLDRRYGIKRCDEPYERVVRECDLDASEMALAEEDGPLAPPRRRGTA